MRQRRPPAPSEPDFLRRDRMRAVLMTPPAGAPAEPTGFRENPRCQTLAQRTARLAKEAQVVDEFWRRGSLRSDKHSLVSDNLVERRRWAVAAERSTSADLEFACALLLEFEAIALWPVARYRTELEELLRACAELRRRVNLLEAHLLRLRSLRQTIELLLEVGEGSHDQGSDRTDA